MDKFLDKLNKIVPKKWQWILNHEGFRRYFKNTGWMFFGQMFSLVVSFFIGAWIARYLGPENYGVLNYAVAFVGLFGFISSLGVDGILNRELVKYPEKRDELMGTSFWLKVIGGLLAFILCLVGAFLFQNDNLTRLLITLYAFTFIFQATNVINIYFQAEVKSKNGVKAYLFSTLIVSLLKVLVILLDKGVIWIMIVYVLDSILQCIFLLITYQRLGLILKKWQFKKALAFTILKDSWPLMLATVSYLVLMRIDQVMLGHMMGNREVGLYAAAVKLAEIWYFIPGIICASLLPAIINAKKIDSKLYKNRLYNLYWLMAIISVAMAIVITLIAKPVIYILFGGGYAESAGILRIYIWSSIGLFIGSAVGQYLLSENYVKTIFWLNFTAMAVNIILNLILIPIVGMYGAAWSTLVSYLVIPTFGLMKSGIYKQNHKNL